MPQFIDQARSPVMQFISLEGTMSVVARITELSITTMAHLIARG